MTVYRGNDFRASSVLTLEKPIKQICRIFDTDDLWVHRRRFDQMHFEKSGQSTPHLLVAATAGELSLDTGGVQGSHTEVSISISLRQQMEISRNTPDFRLSRGQCNVYN